MHYCGNAARYSVGPFSGFLKAKALGSPFCENVSLLLLYGSESGRRRKE